MYIKARPFSFCATRLVLLLFSLPALGDTVLQDFEKSRDANMWEVQQGPGLSWEQAAPISGSGSLRIPMDTLMQTSLLQRDWSGHTALAFDIHNPFDTPISIKMVLSDDGWLDRKSHWNQHHRFLLAAPGTSTITIPLASLYRGTEAQRNLDLKTPFNLNAMMRMELEFKGQRGDALLDNLRLLSGNGSVALVPVVPVARPVVPSLPAPASVNPPALAGGIKIINGFESLRDVVTWEAREGWFEPEVSDQHVTEGKQALKVAPGTLLVNMKPSRSWAGYDVLEFDGFVEGEEILSIELMIGDDAWTNDQHYYNRHNSTHRLVPGPNTVRIMLGDLYRGESQKKNSRITRNIDLEHIAQINLRIRGKSGYLYMDGFRLSRLGEAAPAPQAPAYVPAPAAPVRAVTVQPSPGSPTVGSGSRMLCDFESLREVLSWEKREGWFEPIGVPDHASSGKQALKVGNDSLLVNMGLSRNWAGYTYLEMDVFVESDQSLGLEVMIGDSAWNRDQNYYNRYNAAYRLLPGTNTLKIVLGELYRGEAQKRNTRITRNIDLDAIAQMNLRVTGKYGYVYLDALRLTGGPEQARASQPPVPPPAVEARRTPPPGPETTEQAAPEELAVAPVEKKKIRKKGDLVWGGFESERELLAWEVRNGYPPEWTDQHVTEGLRGVKFYPDTLLANYSVPKDWQGYDSLAFDVFWEGDTLIKLEVMLGDEVWTQHQTYWNRYNNVFSLVPGANTFRIPVDGLFRGEPASRNRDIKGNLDASQMRQLNLWFKRGKGTLYLDNVRFEGYEDGVLTPADEEGGERVEARTESVFDFESMHDLGAWTLGHGPEFERVNGGPGSNQTQRLKVNTQALISSTAFPRDWSAFDTLAFDAYLESDGVVKMELMVGDEAWTEKQTYWNRFNRVLPLLPGENHIELPVSGLYRGEPQSRNRDIKRNIDVDSIVQVNVGFIHGQGQVYLDDFVLKREGRQTARVYGFDFGPEDQAVWPGFQPVSWNTEYSEERGYGFEQSQPRPKNAGDASFPTRLLQDYVHVERGDFRVDLPNGLYQVQVFFEDAGYWGGEYAKYSYRSIAAEGSDRVVEDRRARGPHAEALTLFEDMEPSATGDPIRPYIDRLYGPRTFEVKVDDGQLNLIPWSDAQWGTRVSAILVYASGDKAAEAFVTTCWEKNLEELRSKAAWIKPRPQAMPAFDGPVGLFLPSLDDEVLLSHRPPLVEGVPRIQQEGFRGQTLTYSFGLLAAEPLEDVAFVWSGLEDEQGNPRAAEWGLSQVRHLAKRTYEDLSYRIVPWYLHPAAKHGQLPAEQARQYVLEVDLPAEIVAGSYRHSLTLRAGDRVLRQMDLVAVVHPQVLPRPDFPITFFGMRPDDYALFARMGATAISGGGAIRVSGWKDQQPLIDFSAVDAVFEKARAAGLDQCAMGYGGPVALAGMKPEQVAHYFSRQGEQAGLAADETARRIFQTVKAHAAQAAWPGYTINLVDEPQTGEQMQRLVESARFLKQAVPEWPSIGYMAYTQLDPSSALHPLFKNLHGLVTKGYDASLMEEAERGGQSVFLYSLGRKRYVFGPLLWAHRSAGIAGYIQWHASLIHGYQFFDLDGREPDMGLVVRRSDGVFPSLDLLRIREGIYDLRYLMLLESLLARTDSGAAATAAQAWLDSWRAAIDTRRRGPPEGYAPRKFREDCLRHIQALD